MQYNTISQYKLRNYQNDLIKRLTNDKSDNKYVVIPYGVGKTIAIVEYLSKTFKDNNILIVCEYKNNMYKYCKYIEKYVPNKNIIYYSDDVITIKNKGNVFLCTYDNLFMTKNHKFDIGIYNDANKLINDKYNLYIGKEYQVSQRIYITPTIMDADHNIIFKNMIYNYSYNQAINDKLLLDYKIECHSLSDSENKNDTTLEIIKNKIVNNTSNKIVVYFQTIESSEEFETLLNDYFDNDVDIFNVNSKKNNNDELIDNFKSSPNPSILCVINKLYTQDDVSCVDTIIFYNKDNSFNNIIKDVSMCLKLHENKNKANICVIMNKSEIEYTYLLKIINKIALMADENNLQIFDKIIFNDSKTKSNMQLLYILQNDLDEPIKNIINELENELKQKINNNLNEIYEKGEITFNEYKNLLLFVYNLKSNEEYLGPVTFREHSKIINFIKKRKIRHIFNEYIFFFKDADEVLNIIKGEIQYAHQNQLSAIIKLFNFLRSPKDNFFTLFGFSGSGKTTTISIFIKFLMNKMFIHDVTFATPTNTAHKILQENFSFGNDYDESMNKHTKFTTMQKALCRKNVALPNGLVKFEETNTNIIKNNDLFIIDECSMLAENLINEINKKHERTKIIYCGDPAQLPPVNEKDNSIVRQYTNDTIKCKYELTCNIRQKDEQTKLFFTKIRKWVFDNNSDMLALGNIFEKCRSNSIKYYKVANINKFISSYINDLKHSDGSNILIGYNQCNKIKHCNYVDVIKKRLFPNSSTRYNVDEPIIFKKSINLPSMIDDKKVYKKFFTNSRAKITHVGNRFSYNISCAKIDDNLKDLLYCNFLCEHYRNVLNNINYDIRNCINSVNYKVKERGFGAYYIKLLDKNSNNPDPNEYTTIVIDKNNKKDYNEARKSILNKFDNLVNKISDMNINYDADDKIDFREHVDNIKYLIYKMFDNMFFNIANIESYYYITTHSAQGLSIDNVYVDLHNIQTMWNMDEMKKCIYTALSRAKNNLHILCG